MPLSPIAKLAIFLSIGAVLFIFGLSFGLVVRGTVDTRLKDLASVCGDDDDSYDSWRTNTGDDDAEKFKMYFGFNATNAAEYLSQTQANPVDLNVNMLGRYAMRQKDTFYNVSFTNDNTEVSYKTWTRYDYIQDKSCPTCSRTDLFTNLNPALLTLFTQSSETVLALGLSNLDPAYAASFPRCNASTIPYSLGQNATIGCDPSSDPLCCCDVASPPTDAKSCIARGSSLWSTYASYDNGVEFTSPLGLGQKHSPLFLTKTVHEAAFGYPSAIAGALAGIQAAGNQNVIKPLAEYTELVLNACNYSVSGLSPPPEEMEGKAWQHLGLISCSPAQATFRFANLCPAMFPSDPTACLCAADTSRSTTPEKPCCTTSGLGCLFKVKGYVSDEQYLSQDQSYVDYTEDGNTQNTGCGDLAEGEEFWWTEYESRPSRPAWSQLDRELYTMPTQSQVRTALGAIATQNETLINRIFSYSAPVRGGDGTRMKGTGKTSSMFSSKLSDGNPAYDEIEVFVTQVYRSTVIEKSGSEDYEGITVARFTAPKDLLAQNTKPNPPGDRDNGELGAGTPFDGVQAGVYLYGFPVFISRPLFLHGDQSYLKDHGVVVQVDGSEPEVDAEHYDTYLLVEPASGMTIAGHKRLQASFAVYKCETNQQACIPGLGFASMLTPFVPGDVVVPQYYMDETSAATDSQISDIKAVGSLGVAADVILVLFPIVAGVFWAVGAYVFFTSRTAPRSTVNSLMSDRD